MAEAKKTAKAKPAKVTKEAKPPNAPKKRRSIMPKFIRKAGGYFKNSWNELRYTKWPNRRATLSLTLAVIVFSTLIMLFIVALDYVFNALFERLIT